MQNLEVVTTGRRDISIIQTLYIYSKLPTKKPIINWYHTLLEHIRDKKQRINVISGEIIGLWEKFSF